ncbi:hypothetical protein [Catenulispora rubra]|uniref:hypothetical protein n=1 Tax=Catenulispora rubra TaxID=280293 RepID=UPI0018926B8B|nr:hypothetical protein [Catenulispora rubra]
MDVSALLLPGAQKVATAMLGDAWNATRDAIARRWGRGDKQAVDKVAADLEVSRTRVLALAGGDAPDERLLTAYWMGYLAGVANDHPDWLETLADVVTPQAGTPRTGGIVNTGEIGKFVKIDGDVNGGLRM